MTEWIRIFMSTFSTAIAVGWMWCVRADFMAARRAEALDMIVRRISGPRDRARVFPMRRTFRIEPETDLERDRR